MPAVEKVCVFVMRDGARGKEVLLFEHPSAGIQVPAGTVELGESPAEAAVREVREETGLAAFASQSYLGARHEPLEAERRVVYRTTAVFSRPDAGSFDWATLRRGLYVRALRQAGAFTQITYEEWDQVESPTYVTYCITGWVPTEALAAETTRHYYRFECGEETADRWSVPADNHVFILFWTGLDTLSEIPTSQRAWLDYLLASEAGA
jgi:8-oxo-dGTP pyrophosphatase MutT (NUDIX family)